MLTQLTNPPRHYFFFVSPLTLTATSSLPLFDGVFFGVSVASTGKSSSVRAWVRAGLAGRLAFPVDPFSGVVSGAPTFAVSVVLSKSDAVAAARAAVSLSLVGWGLAVGMRLSGVAATGGAVSSSSTCVFFCLLVAGSAWGATNLLWADGRAGLAAAFCSWCRAGCFVGSMVWAPLFGPVAGAGACCAMSLTLLGWVAVLLVDCGALACVPFRSVAVVLTGLVLVSAACCRSGFVAPTGGGACVALVVPVALALVGMAGVDASARVPLALGALVVAADVALGLFLG